MDLLNSWLLLGCFVACALLLGGALVLVQRAEPAAFARKSKAAAPQKELQLSSGGDEGSNAELRRQLAQAGFTHPDAVRLLTWVKLGGALLGFALAMIIVPLVPVLASMAPEMRLVFQGVIALFGYFAPVVVVDKRRAAWLRRIELALPDALDFMLICVEAGQSTDIAVKRVAEELAPVHPELSAGFVALTEALAAGAERQEAWMRLSVDTDNDDLRQLATIIVQSATMGTPVAHTLRVFSADLRDRRVRRIEEKANILPTKMTLGTMMFTVPPLLILLLAPALYRISSSF